MILPICPDCGNIFKYEPFDELIKLNQELIQLHKSKKLTDTKKNEIINKIKTFIKKM